MIETFNATAEEGIARGESIGIVIALIVMAVVFGTLVAAGLPIVLTLIAVLITMSAAMATSHVFNLDSGVAQMISMIGLAVGVDYSLFIVSRFREERERGRDVLDAITRAGDTASKAILFSGLTVVVSLMGMLIVPWNIMTSLGAAILVVIISVLMTLTLLPAVLSLFGDRINRGKLPLIGYRRTTDGHAESGRSGFWNAMSRAVMRRPVVSLVGSVSLLLFLGSFAFSMSLGSANLSMLPESSNSIRRVTIFQDAFPGADYQPATIVVEADDVTAPEVQRAIDDLLARLAGDPFFGAATVVTAENDDLVRIDVELLGDAESNQAIDAVERLRNEYIPPIFTATDASAYVTGDSAFIVDVIALVGGYLPLIFGFVLHDQLHPAAAGVPLDRRADQGDCHEPALGLRRLRPAGAGLSEGCRGGTARVPAGRTDRRVHPAGPLHDPLRTLDGLPRLPPEPDQGALRHDR